MLSTTTNTTVHDLAEVGVVAVPQEAFPPLTADQVRETLERVRR
jgi:hypothetical protein